MCLAKNHEAIKAHGIGSGTPSWECEVNDERPLEIVLDQKRIDVWGTSGTTD